MAEKADENESYSRKDSLRISGIPITPNEDNISLQAAVVDKLSELGVVIDDNDFFRLHRSGKPQPLNRFKQYLNKAHKANLPINPEDNAETAEVIVRFTRWAPRAKVYDLHYKKNVGITVKCDLTKYRQDILRLARQYLSDNNLRGYCYNNAECKLIMKDVSTNKRHFFTCFEDFKFLAAALVVDPTFHKRRDAPSNDASPTNSTPR